MRFRRRATLATILLAASLASAPFAVRSWAADDHCDQELRVLPASDHPYGYHDRGERCEGLYVRELSSTTLLVASWTARFENDGLSSVEELPVAWESPVDEPVHLRARGLRRQLYYRMDSTRPPGDRSFAWPTDVLSALQVRPDELGVVGWTEVDVGGVERIVHLPIAIGRATRSSGAYEMIVVPGRELSEVFLSLTKVGTGQEPDTVVKDGEALGYGYYPAERGIPITIADLPGPGIYALQVGALLRGGGAASLDFWFYHPGGDPLRPAGGDR